jgi:hypothetical protein
VATKGLTSGLGKEYWDQLTQDVIMAAWDFDEAYGDKENTHRENNNNNDAFIGAENGYEDLEEADLMIMTTIAAGRDDINEDND